MKFPEYVTIPEPLWPPHPASLFGTSTSFSTLQLDIFLEMLWYKLKLVVPGCLEKGEIYHLWWWNFLLTSTQSIQRPSPLLTTSDLNNVSSWILLFLQQSMINCWFSFKIQGVGCFCRASVQVSSLFSLGNTDSYFHMHHKADLSYS